jgi:hypothetical protein
MEADKPQPFVVNGKEYPVPEKFDLGEMCDAENFFGVNFEDPGASRMRLITATLYIAIRRVDPSVTIDDVRAIDPEDLFAALQVQADAVPPSPPPSSDEPSSTSDTSGSGSANGGGDPDKLPLATGMYS